MIKYLTYNAPLVLAVATLLGVLATVAVVVTHHRKPRKPRKFAEPALNWTYGGEDGSRAVVTDVEIEITSVSKSEVRFRWVQDMSLWGVGHTDAGQAFMCLFVKDSDGIWRGGKFEWVSSSRVQRDWKNVLTRYGGWDLSRTPNPCEFIMFPMHKDRTRRGKPARGVWQR